MAETVLVLSHRRGFEADRVIDGLRDRGVPVFRFNADPDVPGTTISLSLESGRCRAVLHCDGRSIEIERIGAAWLQQLPPRIQAIESDADGLQRENFLAAWCAVVEDLNCAWINQPSRVLRAANKALQLRAAAAAGLRVPPTLVSNDADEIRAFSARYAPLVAKNLATPWFSRDDSLFVAYTKPVEPDWLVHDEELQFAPTIYQPFCRRRRDYRIVVLGGRTYSVACENHPAQQIYDIRRARTTGDGYSTIDLPPKILEALLRLLQGLGLDYCSADLIESEAGEFYFLDLNATGAWWWVDDLHDGAIGRALVEELARRARA